MTEQIKVAVELNGEPVPAGTLYVRTSRTLSSTFSYDRGYLSHPAAYELDPALQLGLGAGHVPGLPGAFTDAAPDRWGRNLIRRSLRLDPDRSNREVTELDYLLEVSDLTRQGALRFSREPDGPWLAPHHTVPKLLRLPQLVRASDSVARDDSGNSALKELLDAGSASLGGARPKASVTDGSRLLIAKFPHPDDDWDVMAWEATALDLATAVGIVTPLHRTVTVDGRTVLLLERFDRDAIGRRIGYVSAMSLLQQSDGVSSDYLDIAEGVARTGSSVRHDLRQLWTRIAFSIAINNTDDHLRNHGFLRDSVGWRLSPAFDLNPNPTIRDRVTALGGESSRGGCADELLAFADSFGVAKREAVETLEHVAKALRNWRAVAATNGIRPSEIDRLATAFNPDVLIGHAE